jgi:nucleotide-binding universal stress UspA family protein
VKDRKSIFACINGMPFSESVCDYSSWVARKLNLGLSLFHSLDHIPQDMTSDLSGNLGPDANDELLAELVSIEHERKKLLQRRGRVVLERAKRRAERRGIQDAEICLKHGSLTENLILLKEEIEIVVIGRYGQNHVSNPAKAIGHKVESVIRSLEKPVLVVSQAFSEPTSALLAYDGSDNAKKALSYLMKSHMFVGLEIHVVYMGEETPESIDFLAEAALKLKNGNYQVNVQHLHGVADEALLSYINKHNIGLTAMGAFGHHWLRKLLVGSFTSKMLSLSSHPLLLVR